MKLTEEQIEMLGDRYGWGETQEAIIAMLDDRAPVTVGEIADALACTVTFATSKVKRMERYGFVRVHRGKGNRRLVRLPLRWPEPREEVA
jgi:DNA-binding MarR family transcriptional regulator